MRNSSNTTYSLQVTDNTGLYMGMIYLVISILVLATNAIVILVMAHTKKLQSPSILVLSHMAFWDFMQGLHVLVFVVPSAFLNKFAYTREVLAFAACGTSFLAGLTALNTASAVVDRFLAVSFPIVYRNLKTKHVVTGACVLNAFAVIRMCLIAFPDKDFVFLEMVYIPASNFSSLQGTVASIVSNLLAFGTIVILSISMIISLKRRNRRLHSSRHVVISKQMAKITLMVILSAGVFCLSYVPVMISVLQQFTNGIPKSVYTSNISKIFSKVVIISLMSNSIWNVFIYTIKSTHFRSSLIAIFCKSYYLNKRRKRQICDTKTVRVSVISSGTAATNNL